jgi:phosphoglucomutase
MSSAISPLAGKPAPQALLVDVPKLLAAGGEFTPTPADNDVTGWIETRANALLESGLQGVRRIPYEQALRSGSTHPHDLLNAYVGDLGNVLDMEAIRSANISMGVDPLGGAGVHYWGAIAERYGLNLTVVNEAADPTFRFMTVDWDGRIRMDPSSSYAMQSLIDLKDRFDIAFACDTDHDRHGVVTRHAGLRPPNHCLAVAIHYLFRNRPQWGKQAAAGKTVVSSQMIDRVTAKLGRGLYEVPVGFKWFVDGPLDASLGFAGEESAGASFLRRDGTVWTTDKDGIAAALLAAELTARFGRDLGEVYPAEQLRLTELAGEPVQRVLTQAPGNGAPLDGVKVEAASAWFAARPSGTENIYKIYAGSFRGADHLRLVLEAAQTIVDDALRGVAEKDRSG